MVLFTSVAADVLNVLKASKRFLTRTDDAIKQYNVKASFESIVFDVTRLFPESRRGNHYILVAGGYFSKWTETYTLPNQETLTTAKDRRKYVQPIWNPIRTVSDQVRNFKSQLFKKVYEKSRD